MDAGTQHRLSDLRDQISANDRQILSLLNRRLDLVEKIWKLKAEMGVRKHDSAREDWIRQYLQRANHGPLSGRGVDLLVDFLLDSTEREVPWPRT